MDRIQMGIIIDGKLNFREKTTFQLKCLTRISSGIPITISEYDAQWYKAKYRVHRRPYRRLRRSHRHPASKRQ